MPESGQPPTLSIVIPCYDEGANLDALVARCRVVASGRAGIEFVLVNNGSRDDSAVRLATVSDDPLFTVATARENVGYGNGILTGLQAARGEVLAWTHADLQTDVADVLVAFDLWRAAPDPAHTFVRGRRVGRPAVDAFFTAGMALVSSLALGVPLHDINAQPKLFPRSFFSAMTDPPKDFSLDLYALCEARGAGWALIEFPVRFRPRTAGVAKGGSSWRGKPRLAKRTLSYILKLRARLRARGA